MTDFVDVVPGSAFYPFVMSIAAAGVTSGCVAGQYCGSNEVTRAQMAMFMVRGLHGPFFVPPPATGIFADVPLGSFAVDWIEQFYREGITSGCAGNPLRFCPDNAVTRAQMAVFLLRAKHGSSYVPPACTGLFADVSCAPPKHPFVDWIEQLAREGITSGCASATRCATVRIPRCCGCRWRRSWHGCLRALVGRQHRAGGERRRGPDAHAARRRDAGGYGHGRRTADPPGQLSYAWSKQGGPGTVTFGRPRNPLTSVEFSAAGTYVLRLTVSDGASSGSDDVQVTVSAGAGEPGAGGECRVDQTITLPASANLAGCATDDGLPNPPGGLTYAGAS